MLGSRIVLAVPDEICFGDVMSEMIVRCAGKYVDEKYGVTYGIEIIPKSCSEHIMHICRETHDTEHNVIIQTKSVNIHEQV